MITIDKNYVSCCPTHHTCKWTLWSAVLLKSLRADGCTHPNEKLLEAKHGVSPTWVRQAQVKNIKTDSQITSFDDVPIWISSISQYYYCYLLLIYKITKHLYNINMYNMLYYEIKNQPLLLEISLT